MNPMESLTAAVVDFAEYIERLPAEAKQNQEVRGPKEVLAHLVADLELYLAALEAQREGEDFVPPQGSRREVINKAVEGSRVTPADALALRLQAAASRLGVLYQEMDPQQTHIVVLEGQEPQSLAELVSWSAEHIRTHLQDLQDR